MGALVIGPSAWHHKRADSMTQGLRYRVDALEPLDDLRALAFTDFQQRHGHRRCDDRVLVNWLRHERTPYELHLQAAQDRQGAVRSTWAEQIAYETIRAATMKAITERFPELAHACATTARSKYLNGTRIER